MPKKTMKAYAAIKGGKVMDKFYRAWWFLNEHPMFERTYFGMKDKNHKEVRFDQSIDIYVPLVQPHNHTIDFNDTKKNTKVEVWLECGPWYPAEKLSKDMTEGCFGHDLRLDCGADTFEEAIIKLARLVKKHYGDKKSKNV